MNRISRAVCLFSVISLVRSAAISDTSPAFTPISTPLESDPAGTPTDTGFPTTPDPTPTDPGTGGFLLVGVYTTCLTLTFAGPTGDPFSDPSSASVTDSVITVDAASSGATSRTVPVGTVTHVPERAHRHRSRTQSLSQIPTDFPLTTSSDSDPFPGGTADPQPTPTVSSVSICFSSD
ncbi:hypothetical protein B0H17DRAFT_1107726, partial [Mycena rosella]